MTFLTRWRYMIFVAAIRIRTVISRERQSEYYSLQSHQQSVAGPYLVGQELEQEMLAKQPAIVLLFMAT